MNDEVTPKVVIEEKPAKGNELITIDSSADKIKEIFCPAGVVAIMTEITVLATDFEEDLSTAKGRELMKSQARKVSSSKSYLQKIVKSYTEPVRDSLKILTSSSTDLGNRCDILRDKIKAPVVAWEAKEARRVEALEKRIQNVISISNSIGENGYSLSIEALQGQLASAEAIEIDESWEEFELKAFKTRKQTIEILTNRIEELETIRANELENERLRLEKEEADKKEADRIKNEHEKEIAEAAAKKAKEDAEAREAKLKADKIIADKTESDKKAERDRVQAKKDSDAKIEQLKKESKEREDAAIKKEKQRQIDESAKRTRIQSDRDTNKRIQATANKKARDFLAYKFGIHEDLAKRIVVSIALGEVPGVSIRY